MTLRTLKRFLFQKKIKSAKCSEHAVSIRALRSFARRRLATMFTESLLESSGLHQRTHRGWTTAASLMLQVIVIATFALVPILYPEALSLIRKPPEIPIFSSPAPPPVTPIAQHSIASTASTVPFVSSAHSITLNTLPPVTSTDNGEPPTPGITRFETAGPAIPLATGPAPILKPVTPRPPARLSHADPATLVHYVKPVYPAPAVAAHITGQVNLHALIAKDGTIESLQLVSGHPLLARAALDAVKQWRYRPYILNGEAVEVETQIAVNFIAGNN
jgi:protein TonB